jgi:hypothetical protein
MDNNEDFTMFILTSKRQLFLKHTIDSWNSNLIFKPKYKIIFDDSNSDEYFNMLVKEYSNSFKIVKIPKNFSGESNANSFIFKYLKNFNSEYFLQVEEDWVLNRPLDIYKITKVFKKNINLVQMRIPRSPWFDENWHFDIMYGSNINYHLNKENSKIKKHENWYECKNLDFFWSNNPNLFYKNMLIYEYPKISNNFINSEYEFGQILLSKNNNYFFGFWAENVYDNYVSHIGVKDKNILKNTNIDYLNFSYKVNAI